MLRCRILSGIFKGTVIRTPNLVGLRPTTDRNREMLFNILVHRCFKNLSSQPFQSLYVLDCFSGTGSLGLEALSRGASHVTFVEKNPTLSRLIGETIAHWGKSQQATLYTMNLREIPKAPYPVHVAFLDPPYHQNLSGSSLEVLKTCGWIDEHTWIILEQAASKEAQNLPPTSICFQKISGKSTFTFFQLKTPL